MSLREKLTLACLLGIATVVLIHQLSIPPIVSEELESPLVPLIAPQGFQSEKDTISLSYERTPVPKLFRKDNLELYLRVRYVIGWPESSNLLLPSLKLFWPHASIAVVFDAEEVVDQWAAANIQNISARYAPVNFRAVLAEDYRSMLGVQTLTIPSFPYLGYHRGHLDMMHADKHVQSKHVGFVDSDAMMVTLVTPESIFSPDGKPRIIGFLSRDNMGFEPYGIQFMKAVRYMLKKDAVLVCMSYFPVMFKREHITKFREYVAKVHNKPFLDVFKEMFRKTILYCHYSMMCNYVWYYHRDDYVFHYHSYVAWRPGWDEPQPDQIKNFGFLTDENKRPVARVSTHATYTIMTDHLRPGTYNHSIAGPWFIDGFCYVANAQCQSPQVCRFWHEACGRSGIDLDGTQVLLFRFERTQSWEWDSRCEDAQRNHYDKVRNAAFWIPWGEEVLSQTYPELWEELMNFYKAAKSRKMSSPPTHKELMRLQKGQNNSWLAKKRHDSLLI